MAKPVVQQEHHAMNYTGLKKYIIYTKILQAIKGLRILSFDQTFFLNKGNIIQSA